MNNFHPGFDMKLEVVPVPVSDVDRAIGFYTEKFGFNLDYDIKENENTRIVQLTPPGSACSIILGTGLGAASELMQPGSLKELLLLVKNVKLAREVLSSRGIEMSEIADYGRIKFVYLSDPDGNTWTLQEMGQAS